MKKLVLRLLIILVLVITSVGAGLVGLVYFGLKGIPESHIAANVPDKDVFAEYLYRDLARFFSAKLKREVQVDYKLLREEPTQVGVGAPKFYAWVSITDAQSGQIIESGAVRVGANAKETFTVTDFVSTHAARADLEQLRRVFPEDVVVRIIERSGD